MCFDKGVQRKKLDQFLVVFQVSSFLSLLKKHLLTFFSLSQKAYVMCKRDPPMDVDFMVSDTFDVGSLGFNTNEFELTNGLDDVCSSSGRTSFRSKPWSRSEWRSTSCWLLRLFNPPVQFSSLFLRFFFLTASLSPYTLFLAAEEEEEREDSGSESGDEGPEEVVDLEEENEDKEEAEEVSLSFLFSPVFSSLFRAFSFLSLNS